MSGPTNTDLSSDHQEQIEKFERRLAQALKRILTERKEGQQEQQEENHGHSN